MHFHEKKQCRAETSVFCSTSGKMVDRQVPNRTRKRDNIKDSSAITAQTKAVGNSLHGSMYRVESGTSSEHMMEFLSLHRTRIPSDRQTSIWKFRQRMVWSFSNTEAKIRIQGFITNFHVKLCDDILPVVLLGGLCDDLGYSYLWKPREKTKFTQGRKPSTFHDRKQPSWL